MQGVLVAPFAMLALFQFLLRLFFVYKRDVVTALTFRTLQPNDVSHVFSPHSNPRLASAGTKKCAEGDGTHRPK
jgi:hypothetical protein